ncbi:error-prone DNA polymerase [Hirschia baltica]|uniref:Error-prone DNA polymerase n=1 Tax=Hirschia baltica (strain ATCC 49814 / DSM 5838 / IFAM 1418) TaxID=582402 RepID=C6XNZ2_HIRBI|nr:DNA polymerase III, alpha subunit [Hirschia baltica ATCC 49814]
MVYAWSICVTPQYAELAVTTNFSFLRGASHAEEFVAQAKNLGLSAIGIADRNTLAGVVRAHVAAKEHGVRLLIGARLDLTDGISLLCYPTDRAAYGRLSHLLSDGKMRAPKGECHISLENVIAYADGQVFIVIPPMQPDAVFEEKLQILMEKFASSLEGSSPSPDKKIYMALIHQYGGKNRERLAQIAALASKYNLPLIATNNVLYHVSSRRPLQDILTCIREHVSLEDAGYLLEPNAERHLKSPSEMVRLFHGFKEAIEHTQKIVEACQFSLDELRYEYPDEPVPRGKTPQEHLIDIAWKGAEWRYPEGVPEKVQKSLNYELGLIGELHVAQYFLTVHDIVKWAREQEILCQGRGSAANSAVCYCLGITSVDPKVNDLLFDRFLSRERKEPPDIDVDFEHERREEVIQYVYERYGRHRAALTATVISYRPRSAVREVCKAFGLSEDVATALAKTNWGAYGKTISDKQAGESGLDPRNETIQRVLHFTRQLIGFPRHLSQHVGGFVLTQGPLVETVPIGNAAMDERTFIEWDKDDIDALGIMKVDILALGMLSCIRKCFDMLRLYKGLEYNLATVPQDDPAVYDMLCKADSVGVFQVESRAQMSMLPRLRPRVFYDLVIEVAIVRPGPIQGDMVHPYLRRRKRIETVRYPSPAPEHGPPDELENILKRTLGVPLFQEQAMQVAIDAAKFTPDEANGLRKAMATFRRNGTMGLYEDKFINGLTNRGYKPDFAQACFNQVKGFGDYGFPESHAASFALLVYVSSWLKCHHPEVFCAAILNSQPMGFYAPAQLVRDAREHDVEVRPPDVNYSDWDSLLEPKEDGTFAVRLGLRQIEGLSETHIQTLMDRRQDGYYTPEILRQRTGLPRGALERLAAADAFRSMGLDRREALWAIRGQTQEAPSELFACSATKEQGREAEVKLPEMPMSEHVIQDYHATRLSLKAHPVSFLRERYSRMGIRTTKEIYELRSGSRVMVGGVVLVRQRPGTASGVVFVTLEDETGVANLIVWPKVMERFRPIVMGAYLIAVKGRVQTADNVTHILAEEIIDRTLDLEFLTEDSQYVQSKGGEGKAWPVYALKSEAARHPRNVRAIPTSRDFH